MRSTRFLPKRWRLLTVRFPGNLTRQLDLARPETLPLLDFSLEDYAQLDNLLVMVARAARPGSVLWDVGGNAGLVSLYFSNPQFQLRAIHTFEPNPDLAAHLETLFRGTITTVHGVALGETEGTGVLKIPVDGADLASFVRKDLPPGREVEVPIRTGDQLIRHQQATAPDVIKIDVEGFEPEVLRGLRETIATHRPVIFFEHLFLDNETIERLRPEGYSLYFVPDRGDCLQSGFENRRHGHNAVFVPDEKRELLKIPGSQGSI